MRIRWYRLWWLWLGVAFLLCIVLFPSVFPFSHTERTLLANLVFIFIVIMARRLVRTQPTEKQTLLQPAFFSALIIGVAGLFVSAEFFVPWPWKVKIFLNSLGFIVGAVFLLQGYRHLKRQPKFNTFLPVLVLILFSGSQVLNLALLLFLRYAYRVQ